MPALSRPDDEDDDDDDDEWRVGGGVWILLFSEGTLFAYNVSKIFSPIVV